MFKEIVDDARRTPDIGRSQKLIMSTLCSGELKIVFNAMLTKNMITKNVNNETLTFNLLPHIPAF